MPRINKSTDRSDSATPWQQAIADRGRDQTFAQEAVEDFEQQFGQAHLDLAYHAAFPLALTPDLLYHIWANFQRDNDKQLLHIPWVAVSDLLLSHLSREVRYETYAMDEAVRNYLLEKLFDDPRFGQKRMDDLADFMHEYVAQALHSNNRYTKAFAEAQRWGAFAYTQPRQMMRSIASAYQTTAQTTANPAQFTRLAALLQTFAEPLSSWVETSDEIETDFGRLLTYAQGRAKIAQGNQDAGLTEVSQALDSDGQIQIAGKRLPLPPEIEEAFLLSLQTWQDAFRYLLPRGRVVPIIGSHVINDMLIGGHDELVRGYADYVEYPGNDYDAPYQIAQFRRIIEEAITDDWALKADYINFLKNKLYDIAEADGVEETILEEVEEDFDDINFSEFAGRLGYPKFDTDYGFSLLTWANLPLPIYLTTSAHDVIERALQQAGKAPVTEMCRWHKGLESIPSVFEDDYEPSVQEPLVYHLHGFDRYPDSLVLTRDDHLAFLVATSRNVGAGTDRIPQCIRLAMADSALVLAGFGPRHWDFRSLYWGLIKPSPRRLWNMFISILPDTLEADYQTRYLQELSFNGYWGSFESFSTELRTEWEAVSSK